MSRPAPDPSNVPSFLIKQVARELSRLTETQLRPLGLGMASLPVLEAVRQGKATTQAELARLLRVEQPRWRRPWRGWSATC